MQLHSTNDSRKKNSASPEILAVFKGPTSKGREVKEGKRGEGKGTGREGKGGGGRKGWTHPCYFFCIRPI